jgi:hypothetical protein
MLEKQVIVDLIETVETGCVQVRTATRIIDNGEQLSNTFHRHVIAPGDDYSQEDARVQAICAAVHTPEIIAAYKALITEQQI